MDKLNYVHPDDLEDVDEFLTKIYYLIGSEIDNGIGLKRAAMCGYSASLAIAILNCKDKNDLDEFIEQATLVGYLLTKSSKAPPQ